ncbi:type VI secretion protein IcmF/TssM N-terminal domain-containing protein [Desulfosarcina ovata]|uniref:Type VI secretion system protein ImpL n=1 Tax=Desulfosarcina ovata subsp. ovata TaxID=2752305 RepID=A0A5K8A8I2_9BACT|nr:type VI secretion protein IcmF/TssM N-terminal domain-containing protein [Desulfosarcina ovata]BBO88779.1 type VI secretion system protein ImpL [Desulfosarcina ovata subsp. ovata]
MKTLIIKILKVSLVLLLIALALLLIFGLVLMIGWPLWVGIFFVIGVIGIVLGIVFVKKLFSRKNEQRFVQQIIAQDESRIQGLSSGEQAGSRELQQRWAESIDTLRKSHLRKYGNPLYVLPWYMIIGESGCGKTTAIKGAELSSPFAEVSRASGISGTRNCDWWFFEQAILLDTAGRYAVPVDQGRDRDEWQKFLSLLAKFRKREPLNGLVVAVAADQLLENNTAKLESAGTSIRQRVDELMRVLGAKFPVYIMVTKCDLIQGAVKFCDHLDEPVLKQAMGRLNQPLTGDIKSFCSQGIHAMGERLKDLRLLMLNLSGAKNKKADPSLLMFPEEFEKMGPGLNAFMRGAFQENPYQETPILRGIYFSSGRQEGTPYSHFLSAMGLIGEKDVLPGTNRGLFLHDFFSRILPTDRGLFAPTMRTLEWSRLTKSIGLTAWVAIVIAICGLLSFSFVKNLKTLRDVSGQFSKPPVLQGELTTDVLTLDRFRQAVSRVEEQNANWWIPRLGLTESIRVEAGLKARYCEIFKSGFLVGFDKRLTERMTRFTPTTAPDVIGQHAMHLARRINLLHTRMEGADVKTLLAEPKTPYPSVLLDIQTIDEISNKLSELYLYYLIWRSSDTSLNEELKDLQTWLKHILTMDGARLNWLVDWVNISGDVPGVTMADFWSNLDPDPDEMTIEPAFTVKGQAAIDGYLGEIEKALFDPLSIGTQKLDFKNWYAQAYTTVWARFADYFPSGVRRMNDRDRWQHTGALLPSDNGPYLSFLETLAGELGVTEKQAERPGWVDLVYRFHDIRLQAKADGKGGKAAATILERATQRVTSRLGPSFSGESAANVLSLEDRLAAGKAFNQYQASLVALASMTDSQRIAFNMAKDLYSEDPADGQSPFFKAQAATKQLQTFLGRENKDTAVFWNLIAAPIRFYHAYAIREAECQLQSLWEKTVFLEVQDLPQDTNLNQLLMGSDGYATKFLKGPAAPFLERSRRKGYFAKKVDGLALDLDTRFLTFLTRGASAAKPVASEYNVTIKAVPTDANNDATIKPHATSLELQCGDEKYKLLNLHYPVKKTFRWSPETCGNVVFKIEIGNLVLTKVYKGYQGFAKFLKDFQTGQRIFRPEDFPDSAAALKRMKIRTITPRYQFSGNRQVIALLKESPGRVPQEITACWGE